MSILKLHGVRMWVTEGCNASCRFCMNATGRSDAMMDFEKYQRLCHYFNQNHFDKIAIMGGEPTIHPDFISIMKCAQNYFNSVFLFTNALEGEVLKLFSPRDKDTIVYNFQFFDSITEDKLLLDQPGGRVLDVVIDALTDVQSVTKSLIRVIRYSINRIKVQLVINNTCNIFKQKTSIVENVNSIYNCLNDIEGVQVAFECNAPLCFTEGIKLPPFKNNTICKPSSVLIDSSFNIRLCNIFNTPLINMFQEVEMIPFSIIENYITMAYKDLRLKCLEKICKDCLFYGRQCNGKCHIPQTIISKEDICNSTSLPWL